MEPFRVYASKSCSSESSLGQRHHYALGVRNAEYRQAGVGSGREEGHQDLHFSTSPRDSEFTFK